MDICLNCNGAILKPNVTYGYSGPICYCIKKPEHMVCRPASKECEHVYYGEGVNPIRCKCTICGHETLM